MLKQESNWSQTCDTCRSAACTVYCRADSAYLCTNCDAQVHAANRLASRHERVRVCESCERAPAAFFCKADAASLCTACDSQIHSANPLARRHQRVPILPISGGSMVTNHSSDTTEPENIVMVGQEEEDEAEAASWLLPSSVKNCGDNMDLVDYNSCVDKPFIGQSDQYQQDYNVPQRSYVADEVSKCHMHHEQHNFEFGFTSVSSEASPIHMVSLVPESTTSEATVSPKEAREELPEAPVQMLSPVERKARVMRYREKKKTRKFEKTIRYASRKVYAEKRPRIKGRFAKRNEVDADQGLSTMVMFDTGGYGIVPSF